MRSFHKKAWILELKVTLTLLNRDLYNVFFEIVQRELPDLKICFSPYAHKFPVVENR